MNIYSLSKKISLIYLLLVLLIVLAHYLFYKSDMSTMIDHKVYDVIVNTLDNKNSEDQSSHVIVVDIDEKSLNSLGQWPWPRILLAQTLSAINSYHPGSIGFDIMFPEKDRTSPKEISLFYEKYFNIKNTLSNVPVALQDNDLIFSNALQDSRSVMSFHLTRNENKFTKEINSINVDLQDFKIDSYDYILPNASSLKTSSKYNGFINTFTDKDLLLRRMPLFKNYKDRIVPTLSLAMLLNINPEIKNIGNNGFEILGHKIFTDEKTNILLSFYEDSWYKKVSVIDLLSGKVPKEMLTGKIVLIGSSATSLHDEVIISGGKKIIGVQVHMTMIDNMLNSEYLVEKSYYKEINILVSLFFSFFLLYLLISKHNKSILLFFLFSLTAAAVLVTISFKSGIYISIGYFLAPFIFHFFVVSIIYIVIDTYDKHLFKKELTRKHIAQLDAKVTERTHELAQSKEKLEVSHKKVKDSIKYASLIQNAILPEEEILKGYTQDFFIFWQPRDTVGGDICFITELESKEEIIVMVIDGAGHGVPGAFVTMLVKAIETQIISEIKNKTLEPNPALILEYFNKSIKTMLRQEKDSKSNAGFDGGVLYYNKTTNVCKYAGAKTPLYILNGEELEVVKGDRHNVGYTRTKIDQKYTEFDISIKEGSKLYITTDGLTDQEGEGGKRYSKQGFKNILTIIHTKPFYQQKIDIMKSFEDFKGDFEQSDDMAVIGLKF